MDEQEWPKLKSTIYSWIWRNPRSNRIVVDVAGLSPEDQTLDIGCGPGVAVRHAAVTVTRAVGVDRSSAMVDIAKRRSEGLPNVEFAIGQAEDLPFPDDDFSVVWSAHSYHHWEDRGKGLLETKRVLAPGGRLLIVETRSQGEHGLSLDGALGVQADLERLGFLDASIGRHRDNYIVAAGGA
jgi:ubiquinone/menaquinone biosynthesis C-methylase UbiE